jgi:hypothetical protein
MESQQDMGDVPKDIDLDSAGVAVSNPILSRAGSSFRKRLITKSG